jgi:tellurium resistance protein TerD
MVNQVGKLEMVGFDLLEDMSTERADIFGQIYCHCREREFKAIGQGYFGGLSSLAKNYGFDL